jgi:hypothetical protein
MTRYARLRDVAEADSPGAMPVGLHGGEYGPDRQSHLIDAHSPGLGQVRHDR